MLANIYWFLYGMSEFRSDCTINPGGDFIEVYDLGRDWAHRLTLRYFDGA